MGYLIDVSIRNSSNLQTAYTEKIIKYAELSIKWEKKQWQIDAVSTLPVTISAKGVIPHKLHDVLKQIYLLDLLYVTIKRSVIINTCNIFRKFLCNSIFQQSVTHIFIFTFVIKRVRWLYRVEHELMRGVITITIIIIIIIISANVKVQNIFHGQNVIACCKNCKYRTSATLCTLDTWGFRVNSCKYRA